MAKRTEVIKKLGEGLAKSKDYTETIWKFANLKANIKILLGNRKKKTNPLSHQKCQVFMDRKRISELGVVTHVYKSRS